MRTDLHLLLVRSEPPGSENVVRRIAARPNKGAEAVSAPDCRRHRDRCCGGWRSLWACEAARSADQEVAQRTAEEAIPPVDVIFPTRGVKAKDLVLPGDIEAFDSAAIYAARQRLRLGLVQGHRRQGEKGRQARRHRHAGTRSAIRPGQGRSRQRRRQLETRGRHGRALPHARQAVVRLQAAGRSGHGRRRRESRGRRVCAGQSLAGSTPSSASKRWSRRSTAW